jgi:hypothetical protein
MSLLSSVRKQLPSADQALIDQTLSALGKTEAEVISEKLIPSLISRCAKTATAIAIKSAAPTENILNTPAMQQATQQHQPKPQALNVQAQSAATQSMNFAPTILVAAAERMNATLALPNSVLPRPVSRWTT